MAKIKKSTFKKRNRKNKCSKKNNSNLRRNYIRRKTRLGKRNNRGKKSRKNKKKYIGGGHVDDGDDNGVLFWEGEGKRKGQTLPYNWSDRYFKLYYKINENGGGMFILKRYKSQTNKVLIGETDIESVDYEQTDKIFILNKSRAPDAKGKWKLKITPPPIYF